MQLTPSQAAAVATVHDLIQGGKPLISLAGPAGTGKTTIINALLDGIDDAVVCTPTNKAAQVLVSKGIDAATFFKTFYILEEKKQRGVKPKFISCRRYLERLAEAKGKHWKEMEYLLPEGKRAFAGVIIIDEASMVTSRMVMEMRAMCHHLILVGDEHQLPPVGDMDNPKGFFCGLQHDVTLTEVLRQSEGSMILQLATEIRKDTPKVEKAIRYFEPQDVFNGWVQRGAQCIAFTNKERQRINHVSRKILGFTEPHPMPGDRVICTNNYSDDLINGTIATVLDFDWDGVSHVAHVRLDNGITKLGCKMSMEAFIEDQIASQQRRLNEFYDPPRDRDEEEELAELTFAYCLTAHKAQGSEWPAVVVFDQRGLVRKVTASNDRPGLAPDEAVRRWIYTAVTRARQDLAIAPTWWAQSYNMDELPA